MRNVKVFAGAVALTVLGGVAMLAGGAVAATLVTGGSVPQLAQRVQAAAAPTAVPAQPGAPSAPNAPGAPNGAAGPGWHGRGGPGPGFDGFGRGGFGPGGFGPGGFGPGFGGRGGDTANGAARVISSTTGLITSVKSDLAYATGKMDTSTVQSWLNGADALLAQAKTASSSSAYGKAAATANAASGLARAADLLMAQALGADKLPSYAQHQNRGPFRGGGVPGSGTAATVTQAQASRELAGLYNQIIATQAVLKNSSAAGDAATYLTAAQDAYKAAYTAYQAGKYSDARASANVSRTLLGVVDSLQRAATAANSPDTPVAVPAPNF